ncbi:MAG: hypothetical protein KAJ63_07700, partial [Methyloprofundus sp.]|nr:hypothetical protein [Methyloprofundus sp.]
AQGAASFELEGLGEGRVYLLRSKPYHSMSAYSEDIESDAGFTFNVGTLQLMLVDHLSQDIQINTKVTLYKRLADGSDKWAGSANSDESGRVRFTPVGLENGETYRVRANSYGAGHAYSPVVSSVSDLTLELGTLPVKVQDFFSQTALADTKVYLYRRETDGSSKKVASATTDELGLVRFTPFGIEQGQAYYVRSKPYDTDHAYSKDITTAGALTFNTGTLLATLSDFKSGNVLASTRVDLYERLADGKSKWRGKGNTDAQGIIRFSPTDLNAGRSYFLRTDSFGAGYAYTPDVSATTAMDFKLGTLNVSLTDYIKQAPLAEIKVQLYKRNADGSEEYVTRGFSDANGLVRFTPLGIETGQSYFLKTKPYDTDYAESVDLNTAGDFAFSVGTLQVKLQNYIDKSVLADLKVILYERLADGSNKWRANGNTDAEGLIRFTPFGMESGRRYYVRAKPYNAGSVNSADIIEAQSLVLELGSNPVTLINGDSGEAIAGQQITAYKKLATGELEWHKRATTDETGVIHFDLDYTAGESYVFKVQDVFGENKKYYSDIVSEKGAVSFVVTKDGENTVDLTPPTISISTPAEGSNVTNLGFQVSGIAADNKQVDKVNLSINDPVKGVSQLSATYDAASKIWLADVTESMLTLGETISLTATAVDLANNQQAVTI